MEALSCTEQYLTQVCSMERISDMIVKALSCTGWISDIQEIMWMSFLDCKIIFELYNYKYILGL